MLLLKEKVKQLWQELDSDVKNHPVHKIHGLKK